ncbi:GlsB/YeaQ/YmgE family stress response membrane protein [Hoyosella sp. G463]|uniref:GlsB/YeaQ/YmgE family stress response membrane protein n=1 Tax=Lolliginicoccus lacisalsi TaxID=2742202 RepID=A0A927PND1_9ACTN|nr:GlsB/YeaQ/YmgE family stress response membrane protein [Lolliginicoccus lacisalsi]MBD8507591.1 GlsB/YeaQ/YmgE family stress response membrane protein [Lolliginicoccus lacisalsi]
MIWSIIVAIFVGAIIGVLARIVLPGKQQVSMLLTVVLGAVGAFAGSAIVSAVADKEGFNIWALLVGIVVAAALIVGYERIALKK